MSVSSFDTYIVFSQKKVQVDELVREEFIEILKYIKRKLTTKPSARNPGGIQVKVRMNKVVFWEWWRAIRDYVPDIGKIAEKTMYKNRKVKEYKVIFNRGGPFIFHLNKIISAAGEGAEDFLSKEWKNGTSAKVLVDENNIFVFSYKPLASLLTVTCKYQLKNKYGNVI